MLTGTRMLCGGTGLLLKGGFGEVLGCFGKVLSNLKLLKCFDEVLGCFMEVLDKQKVN